MDTLKVKDTLNKLDTISRNLKSNGVTVEQLDKAIAELKTHQAAIEEIEGKIDQIKQEVIAPIKQELSENRTAGRFSIFGFYVGAIGLIISISAVVYQLWSSPQPSPLTNRQNDSQPPTSVTASNSDIVRKLDNIEQQLLFPKGITTNQEGMIFIPQFKQMKIASDGNEALYLRVTGTSPDFENTENKELEAGIKIIKGRREIGHDVFRKCIARADRKPELRSWYNKDEIAVAQGDVITIGNVKTVVVRVFCTDAAGRLIGDETNGIQLRVINKMSIQSRTYAHPARNNADQKAHDL